MRLLVIIQARMGSSRLPGKMLMPIIDGKGPLELMLERVFESSVIDHLLIATTEHESDDAIAKLCDRLNVDCFRGNVEDVLDRFYQAVLTMDEEFDAIVRLTGDCPFFNPRVMEMVVDKFIEGEYDYVSNVHPPSFPDGLDVEVFSKDALAKSWNEAQIGYEREHVTQYMCRHPEIFRSANVYCHNDLSAHRWTLDEKEDFDFVKSVYTHLYHKNDKCFGIVDILELIEKYPEITEGNRHIERNEGLKKSIASEELK